MSRKTISEKNWIEGFVDEHGRPPKILHIGNIANNAYQNAKLMVSRGADCDVIANDTCHIMSSPEWDETDVDYDYGDPRYPDWRTRPQAFVRPRWFVQGDLDWCIKYLIAKRKGSVVASRLRWRLLELQRRTKAKYRKYLYHRSMPETHYFFKRAQFAFDAVLLLFRNPKEFARLFRYVLGDHKTKYRPDIDYHVDDYKALLRQQFPQHADSFDFEQYASIYLKAQKFGELISCYDAVIGYSTDCTCPFFTNHTNYVAYEHGTIRELPFEDSEVGRTTLLAYANAAAIFLTNLDCVDSARYMSKATNVPLVYGVHGIDIDRIMSTDYVCDDIEYCRFGVPCETPVFFCPARHTFDAARGEFLKGDEKLIAAAARLAEQGADFRIVFVDAGDDAARAKVLIAASRELEKRTIWSPPLAKDRFYTTLANVDAVTEQFLLHAFGAIDFETIAAGGVLISQKADNMDLFFDEAMPYFACESENDIYEALRECVNKGSRYHQYLEQGRAWIERNHSNERRLELLGQALQPAFRRNQL